MPTTIVTRSQLLQSAREYIHRELGADPADITEEARLQDVEGATSVKLMRIALRAEVGYDITLVTPDGRFADSVGEFVDQMAAALGDRYEG